MPVTTRSQKFTASSASSAAPVRIVRTSRTSSKAGTETEYRVATPKQGDYTLLNSFIQGAFVLYRARFPNIHSWAMDCMKAAMSVAAGKNPKEVYNQMANYAIGVESGSSKTPVVILAAPRQRPRERSQASISKALWSTWVAWYQAFEDEVYDERGPTGRDSRGAVKDSYTYEAVARWKEFAAKKHSLTDDQIENWIGSVGSEHLVYALG